MADGLRPIAARIRTDAAGGRLSFLRYRFKTLKCDEVPRLLAAGVPRAARAFPALIVTGPRRAGKTTLLRGLFPRADYRLLEDPSAKRVLSSLSSIQDRTNSSNGPISPRSAAFSAAR